MRSYLASAMFFAGLCGVSVAGAAHDGSPRHWAGACLVGVAALLDARRVWRALGGLR